MVCALKRPTTNFPTRQQLARQVFDELRAEWVLAT